RAAASALMRGAPTAAVAWLKRALAEPPPPDSRAEVLLDLGSAELRLAAPEAHEHLAAAMETLRQPHLLAFVALQLANSYGMRGDAERSVAVLESAITALESKDADLTLSLEAECAAKATHCSRETRTRAAARLARHGQLAGNTPGERLARAIRTLERARASESASQAVQLI